MSIHVQHHDDCGDHMTFVSMQHIPLSSAYLCEDCHCVGNCAEQCPACASNALMGLARILNREQPREKVQVSCARPPQVSCIGSTLAA